MRIVRVVVLAVALFDGCYQPARAYRPFSGTDAAVAEPGEVEIELGPAEYLRDGAERTLFVPSTTLNYGFAPSWETVLSRATSRMDCRSVPAGQAWSETASSLKPWCATEASKIRPGPASRPNLERYCRKSVVSVAPGQA